MRVTRSVDGVIGVDAASAGRGAWLCRSADDGILVVERCLELAGERRAFARAWRSDVTVADHDAIATAIRRSSSETNSRTNNGCDDRVVDRDEDPDVH